MRPEYFKHLLELREQDFREHPIWVCAYNTDTDEPWFEENAADEATYRPWDGKLPYDLNDPRYQSIRVASKFQFADGTTANGFCRPPVAAFGSAGTHLMRMQPSIFWNGQSLWFWMGAVDEKGLAKQKDQLYSALKRKSTEVFPIQHWIPDSLVSLRFHGWIDGFGWLVAPEFRTAMIGP